MLKITLKRVISLILAFVLVTIFMCGCGSKDKVVTPVELNNKVDVTDTALVINGEKITIGKFRFYIFNAAFEYALNEDENFDGDLSEIDWEATIEDGKKLSDIIIANAKTMATDDILAAQNAGNSGLDVEKEIAIIENSIDKNLEEIGEEAFNNKINSLGVLSIDDYKDLIIITELSDKLYEDFDLNPEKYIKDAEELKAFKNDENVTAQHILIKKGSLKYADPKATLETVLKRAKDGEDFYNLMIEFNEDTSETKAGYYFGKGVMYPEFEEAAFKLDCGQLSDIVETEEGYHIIKRLVGMGELLNYWKSSALINENISAIDSISVQTIIDETVEAEKRLTSD